MNNKKGDSFVNYALLRFIKKGFAARVFDEFGDDSEDEDRHVSELDRRMRALDQKEVFVTVKAIVESNWETFAKTIIFLKQEGEKNHDGIIRNTAEIGE